VSHALENATVRSLLGVVVDGSLQGIQLVIHVYILLISCEVVLTDVINILDLFYLVCWLSVSLLVLVIHFMSMN
jgi:hypothetical protein